MIIPKPQDISEIIEKIRDSVVLLNTNLSTPPDEELSLDEVADEVSKELGYDGAYYKGLSKEEYKLGLVVRAAVSGEDLLPESKAKHMIPFSFEALMKVTMGGVYAFLIYRMLSLRTRALQELLDQVILPLYESDEIRVTDAQGMRTKEGERLDELRDSANRELRRREERSKSLAPVVAAVQKYTDFLYHRPALTKADLAAQTETERASLRRAEDEIAVRMHPYLEYFGANGSWGQKTWCNVEVMVRSKHAYILNLVILELEKIENKMKVEAKQQQEPPEKKQKRRGERGRPRKYTDEELKNMVNAYEHFFGESNDSKGAWNKVADLFSAKSGDAVRVACIEYRKSKLK
jgi:hypothetical protein